MRNRMAVLHLAQDAEPSKDAVELLGIPTSARRYTTVYYPWVKVPSDPRQEDGTTITVPPTGHVAGTWARVDNERGVHKGPANEKLRGTVTPAREVSEAEQGPLTIKG
ncbi:phage tail sheath subtilisin-like domain-containing protein [Streptomyces sp. NPDC093795]|uniref:phage tail sheath subtilisin-like domain-containing protein n=1 Tax=Streptomyces sp. NPDC093795 TaxID=3366051 RepID=UPI003808CD8F